MRKKLRYVVRARGRKDGDRVRTRRKFALGRTPPGYWKTVTAMGWEGNDFVIHVA